VSLEDYGWNDFFARSLEESGASGLAPGRVLLAGNGSFRLRTMEGELTASLSGGFRHRTQDSPELAPTVGDWVAFDATGGRIEHLLPRRTKLARRAPGKRTREQVVAANVDLVLVVMGLDSDFNLRRLERFLSTVWDSGARAMVLLTKLDLCADPEERLAQAEEASPGVEVLSASSLDGRGLDAIRARLRPRETSVLIGSSGVGKSTLINRLLDEDVQKTREVRESDDRGRHTTSHRELFVLPGGALLIDNPGVREIQLYGSEKALERTFEDIAELASRCRFRDCIHEAEPGCAVVRAVREGSLPEDRLLSFRALEKEIHYLQLRQDESAQRIQKQKWRAIHREMRRSGKHRRT
jgi:ribosome biogenesis GTPase / thiamine phosphate phosphatase